jgi:Transketolase, pyrimidine binding domain
MKNGNIQVISCSTTSNYFHALRRQIHRDYRKPLIAFNSKKLLKFKGVMILIFRPILQFKLFNKAKILCQFIVMSKLILPKSKKFSSVMGNFIMMLNPEETN